MPGGEAIASRLSVSAHAAALESRTSAIVLAAGRSSRMGTPKLLLPVSGQTVIQRVLSNLQSSRVGEIVMVVPPGSADWCASLEGNKTRCVENLDPSRGRTSSVKTGLTLVDPSIEAFLLVPGDMPLIRGDTFDAVLGQALGSREGIAVATYQGKRGHPVAFHGRWRESLLSLQDDAPLNEVTRGPHLRVDTDDPGVLFNLNTPEDYEELKKIIGEG